jgi:hypothetical protein
MRSRELQRVEVLARVESNEYDWQSGEIFQASRFSLDVSPVSNKGFLYTTAAQSSHAASFIWRVELTGFASKRGDKYGAIVKVWKENWERVIPFYAFPEEVRRVLYTTNAVESLHMNLRKIITTRGSFPNEEAAMKLLYLALEKCSTLWPVGFLAGWPRWFSFYLCNFPFQL